MKEKIKKTQKGFIQIPLLVIIIASIIIASAGIGVVLHKQGKLAFLVANISETFKGTEEITITEETESEKLQAEQQLETSQKEITQQELEQAKLEAEKAEAETEQLKKEVEETKRLAEKEKKETLEVPVEEEIEQQKIPEEEIEEVPKIEKEPKEEPTWFPDFIYIPTEDEDIISKENVIIIYNKKFDKEWEELQLKDVLNCISVLRDRFKIDLSEPLKTKLLILDKLVGSNEKTYSVASPFGITNFRHSTPENMDYFRKKIEEEEVCLNFHEMTHVFVFVAETAIPGWANEGLATYAEKEFGKGGAEVECRESEWYGPSYYGGDDIEQPYSDLSKPPGEGGEPGIYWYYTGYCFWIYIQKQYGESTIPKILQELKKNENNYSLDFLKDIVNKVLGEDITKITKEKFGVPSY